MLCHQCGSPVGAGDATCPNCGAELKTTKRLKLSESRGLRISQELKAIKLEAQLFPPGEEIASRFVLGELVGKGPFGEVYRARDTEIDAEVALKIFDAEVLHDPRDQEQFLNAARAARSMTQPNVVRIHEAGMHKEHPWVSMQHLEGLSLRKVLDLRKAKKEHFELDELEPIVSQITLALQHVARDFPHGDLKPENIIFLPDLLKVTDAYLLAALPAKSIIPRLKESPYFAPELHTEKSEPSVRADVYSVGVIIGEMMFGADYTPGSRNEGQLAPIDTLVKRATAFDPGERYPTVEALSEDLATLVDTGSLLGAPKTKGPPPPPGKGPPPSPPPAPASNDSDQVATVEYDRDLERDLQDHLLTEEVKRDQLPNRVQRTQTAALPKPHRRPPEPRKVDEGLPWKLIGGIVVALILGAVAIVWNRYQNGGDVEQIGQAPEELVSPKEASPTPPSKDEAPEPMAVATNLAHTQVGEATGRATDAIAAAPTSTNGQTNGKPSQTNQATDSPVAANDGSRPSPKRDRKSTGAPAKDDSDQAKAKPAGTECPRGSALVKSGKLGNYCIDRHEFPGGGVTPRTRVSWFEAKKQCESKGKRLCKLDEWRAACGGRYPYGRNHDPDRCNTADEDGFERSLGKTGAFKKCRSPSGAYDMVGNAHEWVEEQRIAGGGFESDEEVASCRYSSPKSPASSAAYIGFRCCATPE